MKFCFCPECKQLKPKNWYSGRKCRGCNEECVIINVPWSIYGYLMYVFCGIAVVFIFLELLREDLGLGDIRLMIMFGAILVALVLTFIEIGKAAEIALEKTKERY